MDNYLRSWNKLPHMLVLSEIGVRNIGTVEHLLPNHYFHYVLPRDNNFGGVCICIHKDTFGLQIMDEINMQKPCCCSKCVIESLLIKCIYCTKSYLSGGIYRYPNGNIKHFRTDLENALTKRSIQPLYQETYITLPARITDFSATCIGIFAIPVNTEKDIQKYSQVSCIVI